jgi:hypothetical protein
MSNEHPHDNRGFVQHWRRVGPLLEAIKRRELREFDHAANVEIIDALLQLGVDHGQPRTSSGLVELQRRLHRGKQ